MIDCGLTKREMEVIKLACWGYMSKEIADLLGITKGTVRQHKLHAYEKLNVDSIQRMNVLLRHKYELDVLGEAPSWGTQQPAKRVVLKGNHPHAGECGDLIGMVPSGNGVFPKVRLDSGVECFVSSVMEIG